MRSLACVVAVFAATCEGTATPTPAPLSAGCVTDYDSTVDYFPDKISPSYASLFSVEYFNSYKVPRRRDRFTDRILRVGCPQVVTFSYTGKVVVMWQCGTPKPTVAGVDAYVQVPVDTVAVTSTTYIPWVELLGKRTSLVACVVSVLMLPRARSAPSDARVFTDTRLISRMSPRRASTICTSPVSRSLRTTRPLGQPTTLCFRASAWMSRSLTRGAPGESSTPPSILSSLSQLPHRRARPSCAARTTRSSSLLIRSRPILPRQNISR